jgi:hypothetical protein
MGCGGRRDCRRGRMVVMQLGRAFAVVSLLVGAVFAQDLRET